MNPETSRPPAAPSPARQEFERWLAQAWAQLAAARTPTPQPNRVLVLRPVTL